MSQTNRVLAVRVAALLTLAVAVVAVTGCPSQQSGMGTLKIQITDGPFPFDLIDKATVTITRIDVHKAAASQPAGEESTESEVDDDSLPPDDGDDQEDGDVQAASSQPSDDEDESGEWLTIFEGEKEFNLLDLRNGRTDLLADVDIPAGTYTQMRLVVTGGTVTLEDGREFDLKVPSGAQSGIKLHFTFTIEEGQEKQLLLDVDLSRAFKVIPGSAAVKESKDIKGFKFQPSLAMRLINIVQAGSISGLVTDASQTPLASVTVTALRDGEAVASTATEADGTYNLVGLVTGMYTVTFSAEGYVEAEVADVAVTAGQASEDVNAALEAAAPASQPGA